jgi:hypothetical protein
MKAKQSKISELEEMQWTEQATYLSVTVTVTVTVRTFPKPAENALLIFVLTLSILL